MATYLDLLDEPELVDELELPLTDEPDPDQVLVTRKQAARMLACSESRIYRLEQEGLLKVVKFGGYRNARARYRKTDIEALAN